MGDVRAHAAELAAALPPADPATPAEIGDKIADCLEKYRRDGGTPPASGTFRQDLRTRLHLPPLRASIETDGQSHHARHNTPEHGTSIANQALSERTT